MVLVEFPIPILIMPRDVPWVRDSWSETAPVSSNGTAPCTLGGRVSASKSMDSSFLLSYGVLCLTPRGLCPRLFSSFRGTIGTIGMACRGRVFLRLLWLLVRDEVSESSRGPGAMVSPIQRVTQAWSMAFLRSPLIVDTL